MAIRLVLADDHPLILNGLENLFSLEEDFLVVGRCGDGLQAVTAVRDLCPDILLLDLRMPGKNGLDIIRDLQRENLTVRVILLTAEIGEAELLDAVSLGVCGIVLKEMAPQLLVQCIRKVHAGEKWIERHVTRQALDKLLRREAGLKDVLQVLSKREIEIVRMVSEGLRNKEIASRLFISEGTVKIHLHNIYEKLGVDGRMALLRYAQDKGLA